FPVSWRAAWRRCRPAGRPAGLACRQLAGGPAGASGGQLRQQLQAGTLVARRTAGGDGAGRPARHGRRGAGRWTSSQAVGEQRMSVAGITRHISSDSPRIMVVDGSKVVRKMIETLLVKDVPNVSVISCETGAEAKAALQEG